MSEINATGIIGGTIAIGRYVVNDYVITITETEGDYGYTMTITKGDEVQTVTLYGLTSEQYTSMLGYLQQALTAATDAQTAAQEALAAAQSASTSASSASTDATTASQAASQAASSASSASQSASAASGSATSAATSASSASASATSAQTAQTAAETAQTAAESAASNASTSATNAVTSASQAAQSATDAAGSASAAAQTLTQVQSEGAAQIAAIGAEGERVMESIPADYTALEGEVTELKSDLQGKVDEPASEGTSGQVLTTDGNGGRSWTTVQGGGGTDHGIPSGGSSGQVLAKASGTDYDVEWVNQSGGGTVDDELSTTSTNPVQNKIITTNLSPCIGVVTKNDLGSSTQNLLDLPYDSSEFLISSFILSNGSIGNGNNYRNYSVSPLIPVKEGKVALYVPNGKAGTSSGQIVTTNNGYGLYAANGTTVVAKVSFVEITSNIFSITIPEGAAYIRFCFYSGQNNSGELSRNKFEKAVSYFNANWVLIESDSTTLTADDFVKKANGAIYYVKREDGSYLRVSSSELPDKKILVFGDSIWGMDRETGVPLWLQEYCGATVYNGAIGGTWVCGDRVSRGGEAKWQPFDAPYLIQATISQVWTDQDAYASQVASYVASETLPLLKTINMSDIDIVILAYGTNDYSAHTIDEIKNAYAGVISAILTANPAIRILVCCPAWRTINDVSADTYVNSNGFTMPEMNEGIIEMAKVNHVDWIDMFYALPWNQLTKAVYLHGDEVHPTVDGSKIYAHVVNGKLRSMY